MSQAQTTPEVDPFIAAFEHLSSLGDKPVPADIGAKPAEEPPAPAAEEAPTEEQAAPAAEETPAEEQPAEEAPVEETKPAAPTDDDILQRLSSLLKNAPAAPAPAAEQPAPAPAAEQPAPAAPELYTPEEKKFLEEYTKDWPDVAKAEELRRRAEYAYLVGHIFQQVQQALTPLSNTVAALADRTQLQDLKAVEPEYSEDLRTAVVQWVGEQPSYLKSAYERVIREGTVDEVADLISRYKREVAPPAAAPAQATPSRKEPELPPAVKKAAAALAPVGSKRSAVTSGLDPNDFGAAFEQFADKV